MQNEELKIIKKTKPKPEPKHLPPKPVPAKPVAVESVVAKSIDVKPVIVKQPLAVKPFASKTDVVKPAEPIAIKPIHPNVVEYDKSAIVKPVAKSIITGSIVKPVPVAQKIKPKVKVISETIIKPKTVASQSVEKKPGKKVLVVISKRKMAIAKAYVRPGKGRIVLNKKPYQLMENKFMLDIFREPLVLIEEYNKELPHKLDIEIFVHGGGTQGQLVACRNCVAKAFVQYFKDPVLEKKIVSYNRGLLVDDARRVESKKPLGTKARAKKQHSKR